MSAFQAHVIIPVLPRFDKLVHATELKWNGTSFSNFIILISQFSKHEQTTQFDLTFDSVLIAIFFDKTEVKFYL